MQIAARSTSKRMKRIVKNCVLLVAVGTSCFVFAAPAPLAWRMTVEEPDGKVAEVTNAVPRADVEVTLDAVQTADGCTVTGRVVNRGKGRVTAFEGPIFKDLSVDKARSGFYVPTRSASTASRAEVSADFLAFFV